MGRTDPIRKMKQEEKEFHKEVVMSLHFETYIYITWEITGKSEEKKGLYKVSKQ